jgi:hypothetical protein
MNLHVLSKNISCDVIDVKAPWLVSSVDSVACDDVVCVCKFKMYLGFLKKERASFV